MTVKSYKNSSILSRPLIAEADVFVFNLTNRFIQESSLTHYSYQH